MERSILKDVNFTVDRGEKLLLIGPTGSGKSSILNLILGLDQGYTGAIRLGNKDANDLSPTARRQRIAIVPQDPFLYSLSIRENIFEAKEGAGAPLIDFHGPVQGNLSSEHGEREGEAPPASPGEGATRAPLIE